MNTLIKYLLSSLFVICYVFSSNAFAQSHLPETLSNVIVVSSTDKNEESTLVKTIKKIFSINK
jgi:hypothetical protein